MNRTIICIACPRGCRMTVSGSSEDLSVEGNGCPKGAEYAAQEVLRPMRMLTTTVRTTHPDYPRLPVRLSGDIPKERIFDCMRKIDSVLVSQDTAPGDVVACGIIDDLDLLATGVLKYEER